MTAYLPHQLLMVADGFPPELFKTKEERKAYWDANPPKPYYHKDLRLEQDRALREQQKKEAMEKRIDALRQSKGLPSVYNSTIASTQPQEDEVPKYVIKPLDKHGHPVMRAVSSIDSEATDEQINEKILEAVKRGGSKVVNVICVNTLSEVVLAWGITDGVVAPCDVEPFKTAPAELTNETANADAAQAEANATPEAGEEESDMARTKKKGKAKKGPKAPKVKKAAGAGGLRAGSKQEMLYNMLTRKSGCTTEEAVKATGWKSCGLTVWGKKFGLKVTKEKNKEGTTRYYGA